MEYIIFLWCWFNHCLFSFVPIWSSPVKLWCASLQICDILLQWFQAISVKKRLLTTIMFLC